METYEGIKTFYPKSRAEWRAWLTKYSEIEKRVYLIVFHKGSGKPSVGFQEAIDEAICFGWIDSKGKRRDPESTFWRFSKRNPKSAWGKSSRDRAAYLIKNGLMTDRGMAMITLAKQSGTWKAYMDAERLQIPLDVQKELKKNPKAQRNFTTFAPSSKRIVLKWIASARRADTRERRIRQTVGLAEHNEIAGLPKRMRKNISGKTEHNR